MRAIEGFDVVGTPLMSGRTLIEASAGTGKTYTISGIFLRLILEKNLTVEQILVTTYTELATAELRDRIRRLLREILAGLEGAVVTHDLARAFADTYKADHNSKTRLRHALETFDDAAICTIHGFCRRMLQDRAFENRELFEAEFVTDQSPILREIVDDFWRAHFYEGHPLIVAAVLAAKVSPEGLLGDLKELVNQPTLRVIPATDNSLTQLEDELIAAMAAAQHCWQSRASEIELIFRETSWANQPYNQPEKVAEQLSRIGHLCSAQNEVREWSESIEFFSTGSISEKTTKNKRSPQHPFFECCERVVAAQSALLVRLRGKFLAWAREEMKRRKVADNILSFDDLLLRLRDSLASAEESTLARSIRERFPAALIDEFQDTDPIQYAIFDKIYADGDAIVFFIGDPKQAIYGFRGADIFTYLTAEKAADYRYTLTKNWRSETALVDATNALFSARETPFLLSDIPFDPAQASGTIDRDCLMVGGKRSAPLLFSLVTQSKSMTNKEADRALPEDVAEEIVRLLNGNARIGKTRVHPHDIAVLVSTNDQARLVQEACARRRIPAVIYSAANVFKSAEARELAVLLNAIIEPTQERRIRAALATEALGLTSKGLEELTREERLWETRQLDFQRYHELWREAGFIQMLRTVLLEHKVRERLLCYPDGERRLTNILHLVELLHRMCVEFRLGMTGLLKRLNETIRTTDSIQDEAHELRLERDEDAVRIVTVHKSKGLEYGIVFCPFCWEAARIPKDNRVIFHENEQVVFDLEGEDQHRQKQLDERRAEKLRLLYVAVTRARHRAYLVWGNLKQGQDSALSYLLGDWSECGLSKVADCPNISKIELATVSEEGFLPAKSSDITLAARSFDREIDCTYGIVSFTRLISNHSQEPIAPEDDDVDLTTAEEFPEEPEKELTGIFAFPRGTRAGTCLHKIFEELDFSNPSGLDVLVTERLRSFNISGEDEVVRELVQRVLAVPLSPDNSSLTLSRIKPSAKIAELEFYFPISHVTAEKVAELFQDRRLAFLPMSGFMKGYIDLVFEFDDKFYIIDWKSNWLGPDLENYNQSALAAEMQSKFYHLQLHIYSVALERFLRARHPGYSYEKHFGGVFYLFLRGSEPSRPELGIFRVRPQERFLRRLDQVLTQ